MKKLKTPDADSAKAKTVEEAGEQFLQGFIRHHLGCELPTDNPIVDIGRVWQETYAQHVLSFCSSKSHEALSPTVGDLCRPNPFETAGEQFEAEILRRFQGEAVT